MDILGTLAPRTSMFKIYNRPARFIRNSSLLQQCMLEVLLCHSFCMPLKSTNRPQKCTQSLFYNIFFLYIYFISTWYKAYLYQPCLGLPAVVILVTRFVLFCLFFVFSDFYCKLLYPSCFLVFLTSFPFCPACLDLEFSVYSNCISAIYWIIFSSSPLWSTWPSPSCIGCPVFWIFGLSFWS